MTLSAVLPDSPAGSPSTRLPTLRFITCGSVDDGKSTLIGRLLYDAKSIFEDQLQALANDSTQYGTQGQNLDFALLVDGLQAERAQGITIDVAYRFFQTDNRKFIVADTPGHEQYTRNMATAASTAELAVILVDARKGVLLQTQRHSRIAALMGIRHIVLAINKMDLVDFDETVFRSIEAAYREFAAALNFTSVQAIPLSATAGDNVFTASRQIPWHAGPTLADYLETVDVSAPRSQDNPPAAMRMPVQSILRPHQNFRGLAGRIACGELLPGDSVRILPGNQSTTVKEIYIGERKASVARAGDSVALTLTDEIDVSRGDVIVSPANLPNIADQFAARLIWMSDHPLIPGRPYLLKIHYKEVTATVTEIKYRIAVDTGAELAASTLAMNEIATVNLSLSQPVIFEPYRRNRTLGGFILIDKLTFETVGAGMIEFALRRSSNVQWQKLEIDQTARALMKHQTARCIWFTGLSGAGKSTIANLLERHLHAHGKHTYILDGDNVRHGLNRDLGFTEADRVENIRRIAEVAKLMVDAGLIVIVSFISPYRAERDLARSLFGNGEFVEVFVDAPLEECERRDAKGLYAKARRGELKNFTGIDSEYQPPIAPDIHLKTATTTAETCAALIAQTLG
jgi:bifunctional enzyme CysN/CysC